MTSALLITTYNWPEALELVLLSVINQTKMPTEVLIADDGSTPDTKKLIATYRNQIPVPVHHIWHEDTGFKRSQILNKAIASTTCDYIIQVDGDCILEKHFIEDHTHTAQLGTFLYGSRVNIKEDYMEQLYKNKPLYFNLFSKGINKKTRTLRIPLIASLYKPKNELPRKLRGCNMSYWRKDVIEVNGYNEALFGWGKEDTEFGLRLIHKGIDAKRIRYRGVLYHLWHKVGSKARVDKNVAIQKETIDTKSTWCELGINQYV